MWREMEANAQYVGNVWDSSSKAADKMPEYNAFVDKYLRFSSRGSPHSVARNILSRSKTASEAQHRLEHQREAYESVLHRNMSLVDLKTPSFLAAAKKMEPSEISALEVFEKAKLKCVALWNELNVEEDRRLHISHMYFNIGVGEEPDAERIAAIHEEIERSIRLRKAEHTIHIAVDVREGFLGRLQDLCNRTHELHISEVDKKLKPLILNMRKASFDVLRTVKEWRATLEYPAVFLWRGVSYLQKMTFDLNFLAANEAVLKRMTCAVIGNPLLDDSIQNPVRPRKAVDPDAPKSIVKSMMLPPILRPHGQQMDGSVLGPELYEDGNKMLADESLLVAEFKSDAKAHQFGAVDISRPDVDFLVSLQDIVFDEVTALRDANADNNREADYELLSAEVKQTIAAAKQIQRMWRGWVARVAFRKLLEKHQSARLIQSLQRRKHASSEFREKKRRFHAAQTIQALARGVATREAMRRFKVISALAVKMQSLVRGFLARRMFRLKKQLNHCAVLIQKVYFGYKVRMDVKAFKQAVYNGAAVEIQRIWKGLLLRRSGVANPKMITSSTAIQCAWRSKQAREVVKQAKQAKASGA